MAWIPCSDDATPSPCVVEARNLARKVDAAPLFVAKDTLLQGKVLP